MNAEPPARDTVHVWRLATGAVPLEALVPLLTDDETARAERFLFAKDRHQFIAVRGWLRRLLGEYLSLRPQTVRFEYGPEGKPSLARESGAGRIHFNVSHSRGHALLAFATGNALGVDIEWGDARTTIHDLATSCFSDDEQRHLYSTAADQQRALFFSFWASKEAYIKAVGGGLSIPLRDFSIDMESDRTRWCVRTLTPARESFTVQPILVPPGYAGAVAAPGQDWRVETFDVPAHSG